MDLVLLHAFLVLVVLATVTAGSGRTVTARQWSCALVGYSRAVTEDHASNVPDCVR